MQPLSSVARDDSGYTNTGHSNNSHTGNSNNGNGNGRNGNGRCGCDDSHTPPRQQQQQQQQQQQHRHTRTTTTTPRPQQAQPVSDGRTCNNSPTSAAIASVLPNPAAAAANALSTSSPGGAGT